MEDTQTTPAKSPSSAEAMAARREARRKRILENSNNRLTQITGREHNDPPADQAVLPPDVIYPDPEDERDVYQQPELNSLLLDTGFSPSVNGDIFSLLNTLSNVQNGGIPGRGGAQGDGSLPTPPETRLVKIIRTKIHIAVTAVVVYLLFATERQHLIGGNVFILLLGWEMVEVFLLKTYQIESSLLDFVFILGGISKKYSQIILKFAHTINKVLKDVAFFAFFFVLTHLAWSRLVLGIELNYVLGYDRLDSEHELSS